MECKKSINLQNCNCSYSCSKKGVCCDCIKYHREQNQLPACYFSDSAEKSYDRSIGRFLADKGL